MRDIKLYIIDIFARDNQDGYFGTIGGMIDLEDLKATSGITFCSSLKEAKELYEFLNI